MGSSCHRGAFILARCRGKNAMHEMTAETATKLFLAQEDALEHAAAKIYQLLARDAGLTPAECLVVCLRAAAKFLIQFDKNEWLRGLDLVTCQSSFSWPAQRDRPLSLQSLTAIFVARNAAP